jgi:hypothetical protein
MIDNVITVIPDENRFKIIDGQHRYWAWVSLLSDKIIDEVNLHLRILDELEYLKDGRQTYLALDSSKPLTGKDILKVYDDGKNKFFILLSQLCNHYGDTKTLSFFEVLAGYFYATTGNNGFQRLDIETAVKNITPEDIHKLGFVISNLYTIVGRDTNHFIYRAIILRNIVKFLFESSELMKKQNKFQNLLKEFMKDTFLQQNVKVARTVEAYDIIYSYMVKKLLR